MRLSSATKRESGKSTLMRLLLGLKTLTAGSICYDGNDITALDTHHHRSRVGTVLQAAGRLWPGAFISI